MGFHFGENGTIGTHPTIFPMRMGVDTINDVKFHSSWDWIMPVYEKCKDILDVYLSEERNRILSGTSKKEEWNFMCDIRERMSWIITHFDKEHLYDHICDFLKWRQQFKA